MRAWIPELLMITEAVLYLAVEVRLRLRSRWTEGALDHADRGVVLGPLVTFLVAALFFSTGGWDLLRLPGILTVLGLPIALGAAFRALRGDRELLDADGRGLPAARRWQPTLVAVALSLVGLLGLWISRA